MNSIAFIFTKSPHGSSAGREGLDVVLAMLTLNDNVGLFFVSDGVLQLIKDQNSNPILMRNYNPTFGVLSLYDAKCFYVCSEALIERGILCVTDMYLLNVEVLSPEIMRSILNRYDRVMTF
ncbi:sulfurtransferase complex subunit TusC [Candidatus Erwinia haradaeae]|uniref:Protein TusC n=1 Tax=Candidatus Erwinia haradaeae TaxID=1922217 RepID=A0A451D262_9GAMM|nr:sulfurtransferase complex subunit TusC [Candidatus Erwinia haradaeae]VFP79702.1 Protein TusC [Candidatus Erwinia haradaeae]